MIRSPMGLLVWLGNDDKTATLNPGSRLKTPIVPIWLIISGEQSGVLFGEDKGLLRDYQAENRFKFTRSIVNCKIAFKKRHSMLSRFYLNYYTSSHQQATHVSLKINNRAKEDDSDNAPTGLEKIVRTKYVNKTSSML